MSLGENLLKVCAMQDLTSVKNADYEALCFATESGNVAIVNKLLQCNAMVGKVISAEDLALSNIEKNKELSNEIKEKIYQEFLGNDEILAVAVEKIRNACRNLARLGKKQYMVDDDIFEIFKSSPLVTLAEQIIKICGTSHPGMSLKDLYYNGIPSRGIPSMKLLFEIREIANNESKEVDTLEEMRETFARAYVSDQYLHGTPLLVPDYKRQQMQQRYLPDRFDAAVFLVKSRAFAKM